MFQRKYTHTKVKETQITSMCEAGMTRQKIADEFGFTKAQITD